MMKKRIAAILSALLLVSAAALPAQAAKKEEPEQTPILEAALVAPELEKKPIYDNRAPASSGLTSDTVTIDEENGTFTVITASDTQLSITVPFGAYCITQDVFQQLEIYMSLYRDVSAALKNYISHGIHMDIFDFYTGTSTYVAESDDSLAALVGELNTLDETSAKRIASFISKSWYAGRPALLKTVGENQYIAVDLAKEYGFVVYNHITNGKLIEIYTFCEDGDEGMAQLEAMIQELTFGPEKEEQ